MEEELNMKRDTLYDVIYVNYPHLKEGGGASRQVILKEILNGFAIDQIPMLCRVDYQTALEKKSELDKAYNPDYIVI